MVTEQRLADGKKVKKVTKASVSTRYSPSTNLFMICATFKQFLCRGSSCAFLRGWIGVKMKILLLTMKIIILKMKILLLKTDDFVCLLQSRAVLGKNTVLSKKGGE